MKKMHFPIRLLSLMLVLALLWGLSAPMGATGADGAALSFVQVDNSAVSASLLEQKAETHAESSYASTDMVRVSIVLEKQSVLEAGFPAEQIGSNQAAMAYRANLAQEQSRVQERIERTTGENLDVVWNLTLVANLISANVAYGQISEMEEIPGVEQVFLETQHEPDVVKTDLPADPNMSTSPSMIGSNVAWAAGYTGAGSRIAIIDTGTDTDHQSFDDGAFQYSLSQQAEEAGMTEEAYLEQLDLLDKEEIASVLDQLHVRATAEELYRSAKLPFAFNYVDKSLDVTHDNDTQTEHGSHVAGIAAANAYIPNGDGTYAKALDRVLVQGVAPDAQIITMKVFGQKGGAFDSDYMVAIEDAVLLGCDAVNLSLGGSNPGTSRYSNRVYQQIMENLEQSGIVAAMSAGNAGAWPENAASGGHLYDDGVSMQTNGMPGTYTNSLAVASVDNRGVTGEYFTVGGSVVVYSQNTSNGNLPLTTIAGEQNYVYIDGCGTEADWAAVGEDLDGAIAVCSRGEIPFYQKANAAVAAGAIATIVYNNEAGSLNMDLTNYGHSAPCISVTRADGAMLKAAGASVTDNQGNTRYYKGKLTVEKGTGSQIQPGTYHTMSTFSSWGVPGSLELKPEITAPGGNIYSINGSHRAETGGPLLGGSDAYESMSGTSMASPQVAGMAALVSQYIRENGLEEQTGLTSRQLAQSLLMSTAVPQREEENDGGYYPVLRQGAGLANVGAAIAAESYILMGRDATHSYADGKVKVELGDDPEKTGLYQFSFDIHNMTNRELQYTLSADFFTQAISEENGIGYMDTQTTGLDATVHFSTGNEVTVPANGIAHIQVTVALTDAQKEELQDRYPVGAYLEGFVFAKGKSTEEGIVGTEHAIPVLGFYGNWTDASMFDIGSRPEYAAGDERRYPYLYASNGLDGNSFLVSYAREPGSQYYFGGNPVVTDAHYMPERNAINGVNGDQISHINFAPIRNAAASRYQVKNLSRDGEVLTELFYGNVPAAYYFPNYQQWMDTGLSIRAGFQPRSVAEGDLVEISLTLAPEYYASYDADGRATIDWETLGEGASLRIPAVIDNTAPEVTDILVSLLNDTMLVTARDNQYVAAVSLYHISGTKLLRRVGAKQDVQAGEEAQYALDLAGIQGDKFLLQVTDYAMNTATYKVEVQMGEQIALPEMIAFDLDRGFWTSFNKNSYSSDLTSYAPADLTFYAATIVDHYVLASTEEGDLYVMPEDDLTNLTRIANMGTVLTDMALNPAEGKVYGVADGDLVTVDMFTAEVQVVGKIPVTTNTLDCDKDGAFYCNEYGTGKIWRFTLDSLHPEQSLQYDFDGDGSVGSNDVQALLDYATGARTEIDHREYADFDGNGEINTRDAYLFETQLKAGPLSGAELVVQTTLSTTQYLQAMEINPNNGLLCWISYATMSYEGSLYRFAYYFEIDPVSGTYSIYHNLGHEMSCLIIPERTSGSDWTAPTEEVRGVQVSPEAATLLRGSSMTLTAAVLPWTLTDRSVIWSSSNPEVATVDEDGVVTGVAAGTAVITAASVRNPNVSASCTVTIEAVEITLKGALRNQEGKSLLFHWDMTQPAWSGEENLDTSPISVTWDRKNDKLYMMDDVSGEWNVHRVNPSTGKTEASAGNGAEAPFWDLEYSRYFSTEDAPKVTGVYNSYFLAPMDPMHVDTMSFNLRDYLDIAGTSALIAVTSLGYERIERSGEEYDAEHFVLLDNGGYIWNWWVYEDDTGYRSFMRLYASNLSQYESFDSYDGYRYCSLITGEDGNLYLSAYDGETSNFYQMVEQPDASPYPCYEATPIGNVGSSVGPVALYAAEGREQAKSSRQVRDLTGAEPVEMTNVEAEAQMAAGPSAQFTMARMAPSMDQQEAPMSDAVVEDGEQEVTVVVTAKGAQGADLASNNGLAVVTYHAAALELKDIQISGDYTASVETAGMVTFGYLSGDAIDGGVPVATLTFAVKEGVRQNTYVTVTHKEVNAEKPGYVEQLPVEFAHANRELRNAKEATCTEEGYTGDTYCTDCGTLLTKGEVIPAKGHSFGEWTVSQEATCTEAGHEIRICATCGVQEPRTLEALGHSFPAWTVTREPTCTEAGEESCVCTRCQETEIRELPAKGHMYQDTVVSPTCEAEGYTLHTCAVCDVTYRDTFTPALGHRFGEWTVEKAADCFHDGLETSTCSVCKKVETRLVLAGSHPCPSQNFQDVDCSRWYHEGVDFVVRCGMMNGVADNLFQPMGTLTRGQLVTTLYRMAGEPATEGESPFRDVDMNRFYGQAVAWAAQNGIAQGVSAQDFAPNAPVTREQMVTFLYRYAQLTGKDTTGSYDLEEFGDQNAIHNYAKAPMAWSVDKGLILGMEGLLNPRGNATRAQIAVILLRYCENV